MSFENLMSFQHGGQHYNNIVLKKLWLYWMQFIKINKSIIENVCHSFFIFLTFGIKQEVPNAI